MANKEASKKTEKKPVEAAKEAEKKEQAKNKEIMQIKPVITEKAVMLIESQNVLTFKFRLDVSKEEIKKEIEDLFDVKVDRIRVMNRNSKKYAYVKLNPKSPAIDVATKMGMI